MSAKHYEKGRAEKAYEQGNADAQPEIAALRLNLDRQTALNVELLKQRDRLRAALEQALASLRELRGLAWTGSRIPPHLYPEYGRANAADNAACAALEATK